METSDVILIAIFSLAILGTIALFSIRYYKKKDKRVLTLRKMTFFSVMLAIAVAISFLNIWLGPPGMSAQLSFDYIPILLVGFLFGPIEGMLFGILADSIILLIQGWPWQFFMAIQKPIIGLLGALAAYIYYNKSFKDNKWIQMITMQTVIVTVLTATLICLFVVNPYYTDSGREILPTDNMVFVWSIFGSAIVSVVILEAIFIYIFFYKRKELNIFVLSILVVMLARMINSWIFTSIAQQTFYDIPFNVSMTVRMFTTSFAGPVNGVILFGLLKGLIPITDRFLEDGSRW